ncbi:hypothetical protein ABIA31_001332 [Catenulispora sp. MAP5-51]|uniref:hypothetical protein n=1 Tax=Catenulispora sp. MAP5-51 TaxID=3156298 RepID=UPI003518CD07
MTPNRQTELGDQQKKTRHSGETSSPDPDQEPDVTSFPHATLEAVLRQLAGLRLSAAADEQLTQLIRIADSATWSVPIPMTILLGGVVVQGVLVPSEVSATFLDDALRHAAHDAVDELERQNSHEREREQRWESKRSPEALILQHARSFLQRITRRPFATAQAKLRERNAKALVAISRWHTERDHGPQVTPLDIPGNYADASSEARDVVPYVVGQRAITLMNAKMLVGGEWLSLPSPVRLTVGHISAWTMDL